MVESTPYPLNHGCLWGGGTSDRRDYWADGWLGINYQFLEDRDTPAFFGFTEVALFEHQENRNARYRSFIVGGSTYHAIDPVVLSLAASYQFNHAREDGDDYVQPGNSFSLTPSFAFAVNDRVSFSLGTQWALREPDRRNQEKQNTRNSSTAWNAGVAYSATPHNSFNMGFGYSVSGTASIRFNWVHSFARSLEAYALRSRKGG